MQNDKNVYYRNHNETTNAHNDDGWQLVDGKKKELKSYKDRRACTLLDILMSEKNKTFRGTVGKNSTS